MPTEASATNPEDRCESVAGNAAKAFINHGMGLRSRGPSAVKRERLRKHLLDACCVGQLPHRVEAVLGHAQPRQAKVRLGGPQGEPAHRGLLRWEAERKAWLAGGSGGPVSRRRARARTMDVGEVIDDLFSGRGGAGTLPQSVPLPQMIDLLVDLWEAEGLFD